MPIYTAAAVGALGVLAFILLGKAFRSDGGIRAFTPDSWLLFAAVILPSMTTTVGLLLAERMVLTDAFFNRVVQYTGLSEQINKAASPLLIVVASAVILVQLYRGPQVQGAALWFLLLLVVSALAKWNGGGSLLSGGHATLLAVVLAAVFLPRGQAALKGAAFGLGVLLCISAVGAILQPDFAAPPCDDRKCGVLGTFYVGVADNQNTFGLMMAFAVPVFYFGLTRYGLFFGFLATFFAFASGARTAAIAAAATLLIVVVVHREAKSGFGLGRFLASTAAVGAVLAALAVAVIELPPGTFSDRARLWELARSMVDESWLIGHGPDLWRSLVEVGLIPLAAGYSTHNQFMETLFVTGVTGLAIMLIVVVLVISGNSRNFGAFALLMLPVAIASVTERPWSLGAIDWSSWTLLLFLLAKPQLVVNESAPSDPVQFSPIKHGS